MYADELKLKMFRTLTLFFLFSVTPTLVLPTKCDVNFNTSSMLLDCSRSSVDSDHSAYVARKLDDVSENKTVSNITRACSDGGSCIIDATSQSSASPVSPPNLKAPPPSSRPRARRFRSISLSPATAPAPAPESMFRYPDGHFDRSGVVSAVIGGLFIILCCFRRAANAVIKGLYFILRCSISAASAVLQVW
ncbi:hypothetical protein PHAVU_004G155400 [Phaseolus vulgaris]